MMIWHKTATKYTYNDGTRHSAKETRSFIQEEHSGYHQKLTMAKGEQSSKPLFLQLPEKLLRIPHKPLNRFEAERENSLWTCWKSTHSSLWPLSSYTKSLLLVRLSYVTFSSAIGPRGSRAFLKDKLAPETSCNQAWWSALPSAFWTLAKRYLRSVLRKLTRYRTTQCLWLALVKRKS